MIRACWRTYHKGTGFIYTGSGSWFSLSSHAFTWTPLHAKRPQFASNVQCKTRRRLLGIHVLATQIPPHQHTWQHRYHLTNTLGMNHPLCSLARSKHVQPSFDWVGCFVDLKDTLTTAYQCVSQSVKIFYALMCYRHVASISFRTIFFQIKGKNRTKLLSIVRNGNSKHICMNRCRRKTYCLQLHTDRAN